ncbi:tetratricopeptide repeat protein [Sorangium sp. So ce1024]|uniref:tetratricopeptide repeat protein n=1 Tax=Sorangium sp. So ce1024 TaxID=3133327 RepID=UPI003F0B96D4
MTDNRRTQPTKGADARLLKLAQEGETRRLNGEYTKAIECFTQALAIHGRCAWAYAHRGAARAAIDDWDESCRDFSKALDLKSEYGWAYAHWADAHRSHAIYRLPAMTDTADMAATLAEWREQHALIDSALVYFGEAARLSPGSAWTFAHQGAAYTYKYWLEVMPRLLPMLGIDGGHVPNPTGAHAAPRGLPRPKPASAVPTPPQVDAAALGLESFDTACRLNPRYAWAFAFKACLLALIARELPEDQMRRKLDEARACLLDGLMLDVNRRLLVDAPVAKLMSCAGNFPLSIAAGISGVEKNPADLISRYFIAVGLKHMDDPHASTVIEQTRKILRSTRREIDMMLDGLAVLDGSMSLESMMTILHKRMSVESIALLAFDPTWRDLRTNRLPQADARQADPATTEPQENS